jgi:uncharacterized protein with ParB-like and HNH nuclease domain
MKIKPINISIRDVYDGYESDEETGGIVGYGGKLNIRPIYQREYVYKDKKRDAVINSVRNNYPINTMYWAKNSDGTYELLDGQQRTISICEYIKGNFSIDFKYFRTLTKPEQKQILDYKLLIYLCDGNDTEKLDWFRIVNIQGEPLTEQERRNSIYTGPWLTDAKQFFSKNGCPAYSLGSDYLSGSPIN